MPDLALILPGDPATPTGGYLYDRRIGAGLRGRGWTVQVHALDPSFPQPTAGALEQMPGSSSRSVRCSAGAPGKAHRAGRGSKSPTRSRMNGRSNAEKVVCPRFLPRFLRRPRFLAVFSPFSHFSARTPFSAHPTDPGDPVVRDLVDRHQRTDKGFGPALGRRASAAAHALLTGLDYAVREARSPWHVRPQHTDLQVALHRDWHQAARALAPAAVDRLDDWLARRLAHVHAGRSRLRVGHRDLVAWPA